MKTYYIALIAGIIINLTMFIYEAHAIKIYTKDTNQLKVTETEEITTVKIKSLSELKTEKLRLEASILKNTENYSIKNIELKAELIEIETFIIEAIKLGIIEGEL